MEIEIKLLLEETEATRLRQRLGAPVRVNDQQNSYFDDPEGRLSRAGWGLRLRTSDGGASGVLTLKHAGRSSGGFAYRPEYERPLDGEELVRLSTDARALMDEARALLPDPSVLPDVAVSRIGVLRNRRESFDLDGTRLELDRTTWPDGSTSRELEVEVGTPDLADRVRARLERLFSSIGIQWRVGEESKLQRLMRCLGD